MRLNIGSSSQCRAAAAAAAIDRDDRAGGVGRAVGGKKGDHPRDLLGLGGAAEGVAFHQLRPSSGSPSCVWARCRVKVISRSVMTGPGLMPRTRSPSRGAVPPIARVKAISDALPEDPAM